MKKKFAYVWLLMLGDNYLPGVLVSAYSIKRVGTKYDLVCMVTPDVSKKSRKTLRKVLDKVIEVPYIDFKIKKMRKFPPRYDNWLHLSFTKWNCLNLTQYKKIFFLDADCIVLRPLDHIFKLKPPMGSFDRPMVQKNNFYLKKNQKILGHLDNIKTEQIEKSLKKKGFVANASSLLLEPSSKYYKGMINMLKYKEPFGFLSISGHDEQALCYFLSIYDKGPKLKWRNIGVEYQYILWKRLKQIKKVYIVDYMGDDKPWNQKSDEWEDVELWYMIAKEMFLKYPFLSPNKLYFSYPEEVNKPNKKNYKYSNLLSKPVIKTN